MEKELKEEIRKQIAEALMNNVPSGTTEIVIREGEALEQKEPVKVDISGTIDSPLRWLEKRVALNRINQKVCNIQVNREQMAISLQCYENSYYGERITGKLELSPVFQKFGINSGEYLTNFEMADLFKMNRSYFESKTTAMNLVTQLQNFKAKVDKDIENMDNKRGDRRILVNQVVQSNLPEAFNLVLPVFKGQPKQTISVEVYVEPNNFNCCLMSPEANDLIHDLTDKLIDEVLEGIKEVAPDIVIIEI